MNSSPNVQYFFQPLFSYAFKDRLSSDSFPSDIDLFFDELALTKDHFILQYNQRLLGYKPVFSKSKITHLVFKEVRYLNTVQALLRSKVKVIFLVRDPVSVINSWVSAPREFRHDLGWSVQDEFYNAQSKNEGRVENFFGLKKWIEATKMMEELSVSWPKSVCVVNYNKLVGNAAVEVGRIFSFAGLSMGEQSTNYLSQKSHQNNEYSVNKIKYGGVERGALSDDLVKEIICAVKAAGLEGYLLDV
ncbi:hypothetical protein FHS30_001543 [Simiduia aestuariiviva]|uniref:Sulfotransferase domain-containing protein n=1 Tax=Simiduia aestuariiviva TaxID=1510459 RepID=A0A839UPD2_9GAMM|nr:hypothetical protein [Simiduia aestuariiviva]